MKTRHVYLGRFAPFHLGHKILLDKIIGLAGADQALVLIGSSNTLNSRTPYTFEVRKEIIRCSYPNIEVLPLPDGKPNLMYFDGSTNDIWLDSIEKLAKLRNEKFVFYGGSKEDLEILAERFETIVLVDRKSEGKGLSATKVREALVDNNYLELEGLVDNKAMDLIINNYK